MGFGIYVEFRLQGLGYWVKGFRDRSATAADVAKPGAMGNGLMRMGSD